jgi:hypothetical protein
MAGLDGDVCAFMISADPQPLNSFGEALAILAGRSTVKLTRRGGRSLLTARDPWHITDRSPIERGDVLAEHRCGQHPHPSGYAPTAFRPLAVIETDDDEPPF